MYLNKIYIDNKKDNYMIINDRIITFNYEIYNIITSMEFHNKIKTLIMNELIKENKCFYGNFSQNIYKNNNLTFYYCDKSVKEILYEAIPNLKFYSNELNYTFELTKEELFYEKDNYIYYMILFTYDPNTYWIMGQMFTYKYNFLFNNANKQIGFYKKVYNNKKNNEHIINNNKISFKLMIIIIFICIALIFTFIGLFLGKLFFGKKRKIGKELSDEYEYESQDYIISKPINS